MYNALKTLVENENWEDTNFSIKKAHILSAFSALAYECIPEYELKTAKARGRVKIVPSVKYEHHILNTPPDPHSLLRLYSIY